MHNDARLPAFGLHTTPNRGITYIRTHVFRIGLLIEAFFTQVLFLVSVFFYYFTSYNTLA